MFDAVGAEEVRSALAGYAVGFDASVLTVEDAAAVVTSMSRIENMASVIKAKAAARAADGGRWRSDGDRSPAHHLARTTGTTVGAAREALETAKRLEELPVTDERARHGDLSPAQAAAVAEAATADPSAERRLLESAKRKGLAELRDECARTKANADPDPDATHRRIHAARSCTKRRTEDGAGEIRYRSTADEVAQVWAVLQGLARPIFDRARIGGEPEPEAAYLADAMLAMATAASGQPAPTVDAPAGRRVRKPTPTKVIVRIDWEALRRGFARSDEVCEIAGLGPVPVSIVEAMMASGDAFLAAVVTKGVDVHAVAHLGRQATAYQRTGLEWMDVRCTVSTCECRSHLEIDHRDDWAATYRTHLRALDWLCSYHHGKKTRENWALAEGKGRRPMVPPGHPLHPGRGGPPGRRHDADSASDAA